MSLQVLFIGPAGCGKTSLTYSFGKWIERAIGCKVAYINLDPGCLSVPYTPSFDIREMFTVAGIMEKEGLGPNGAMIRASELMEEYAYKITEEIDLRDGDVKLIDTPGQMEIFVFRPSGPKIAEAIKSKSPTVAVCITDSTLAGSPIGLAISISLQIAVQLRLGVTTVLAFNKIDKVDNPELIDRITDFDYLKGKILEERHGAITELALSYVESMSSLFPSSRIVKTSAKTGYGMEDLYDIIREALCCCGDLT